MQQCSFRRVRSALRSSARQAMCIGEGMRHVLRFDHCNVLARLCIRLVVANVGENGSNRPRSTRCMARLRVLRRCHRSSKTAEYGRLHLGSWLMLDASAPKPFDDGK